MDIVELTKGLATLDKQEEPEDRHDCWAEITKRVGEYLTDVQNGMSHKDALEKHKVKD